MTDEAVKYHAFTCIVSGTLKKPMPVTGACSRNQGALGIETVKNIAKPHTFFNDTVLPGVSKSSKKTS
ncbi:MAG: hypothetical protein P8P84_20315 [Paracoccaceae bacterium]|nr:hypothetical protein [Paracoccaceae bacterium]